MNLDWIVGSVFVLLVLIAIVKSAQRRIVSNYTYTCPKCGGSDYFMSARNVTKGIGGIYGNRGGIKKFPVCRKCDEIMEGK